MWTSGARAVFQAMSTLNFAVTIDYRVDITGAELPAGFSGDAFYGVY